MRLGCGSLVRHLPRLAMSRPAVFAALLVLAGCGSTPLPLVASAPAPAVVDGDVSEWTTGLRPVPGESGLSLGVRNTPDALVVALVAGDEWQARRIATGGLTLWLDPAGGSARSVGLRFPVGSGTPEEPAADLRDAPRVDEGPLRAAFEASSGQVATVRGGVTTAAAQGGIAGVETAATWTVRGLTVEARLPLRGPAAVAFAGESTGARVGLGLELVQASRRPSSAPPPSLVGRTTDGRVDGYGADRRQARDTAAPQETMSRPTSGTKTVWLDVTLAP